MIFLFRLFAPLKSKSTGQCRLSNNKKAKVRSEIIRRYVSVTFPLTVANYSKLNVEISFIHEDYARNNNFYLNVTEWLAGLLFIISDPACTERQIKY